MSTATIVNIVAVVMCLAGAYLLWIWELGPAARRAPYYLRVRHIAAGWPYFLPVCLFVLIAAFFAQALTLQCLAWFAPGIPLTDPFASILATAALDLGAIAAVIYARRFLRTLENLPRLALIARAYPQPAPALPLLKAALVGVGAFLISRAIFVPVALAWDWLLNLVGIEAAEQDLVGFFRDETSVARLVALSFIAVVIAPVAEEMVFRGGLFGYLRTRMHRSFAVMIPSLLFGLVHGNLRAFPLLVILGMINSVAYERTGRLATPIIVHALVNLTSIVVILLGIEG